MAVFALAVALSGFLLFLVQPIIAKQLLPWFGGTAAVWTTCLVFFQVMLLAGYAYAHVIATKLTPRTQALVHTALLAAAAATLPITAPAAMKPTAETAPELGVLLALAIAIGLPYFVLSSTTPLLQHWYVRRMPSAQAYRLFAASNVGALVALVSFPFAIEPYASAHAQSWAWSAGFVLFAAACTSIACRAWLRPDHFVGANKMVPVVAAPRPALSTRIAWFLLSALGSVLLLAVTSHLSQNVASVPFLWVLPLGAYLTSFAIVFDGRGGRGWYERERVAPPAAGVAVVMAAGLSMAQGAVHPVIAVPVYLVGLALACVFVHGELAQRKPPTAFLTSFYLTIAAGGAAGGVFVGLIAPRVFPAYYELPFALFGIALVAYAVTGRRGKASGFAMVAAIATAWFGVYYVEFLCGQTTVMARNFYGALRVVEHGAGASAVRQLAHGVILHGEQRLRPEDRNTPGSYFSATSGVGRAIALKRAKGPLHIGVVGLGVGTIAAYGQPQDTLTFYELDPDVERFARRYFTFLGDTPAAVTVRLGDARITMDRELAAGALAYDVLVIDAFSSDAIPAHLLTREAFALYERLLAEGGVLAVHISNKFLDLAPVVGASAGALGLAGTYLRDAPAAGSGAPSEWAVFGRGADALSFGFGEPLAASSAPWTDQHSSLLPALRVGSN